MDRGTYASASAGFFHLRRMELVTNNLANLNTPGFKRQLLVGDTQQFDDTLAQYVEGIDPWARGDHDRTPGVMQVRAVTDFTQGSIKNTGNNLDVALRNPNEFFVINTPDGEQYTRAGNFTLNEAGQVVTMDGMLVQGDGGEITASGPNVRFGPNGSLTANGQDVGRLRVVRFDTPEGLERMGSTRFALTPGQTPPEGVDNPEVEVQSLEMSNVTAIQGVIALMQSTRGFEAYSKMARTIDEMNTQAISKIGSGGA